MEREFIDWMREQLPRHPGVKLALGDDAAILSTLVGENMVITSDAISDGVDFELERHPPRRVGRKALAVNLSDLAAMAARPIAAIVSLMLPQGDPLPLAKELMLGMLPLAEEFEVTIAGGDTNTWGGSLAISVTAVGAVEPSASLRRRGARPGDRLVVTGTLGGSRLGKQFDFTPRVREALLLNERYTLHAGLDISDGLALDLHRLAAESRCGAVLDLDAIPVSDDARRAAEASGRTPLDHALSDGEDFELLLAVPPDSAERMLSEQPLDVPLTAIGDVVGGSAVLQQHGDGRREPLPPRGWIHR